MSKQKQSSSHHSNSFKTIRIVGEKAQKLIESAKERIQSNENEPSFSDTDIPPPLTQSEEKSEKVYVELSIGSVLKCALAIIGVVLLGYLFYSLRDTLLLLFIAVFLAVVLDPSVALLERKSIPRGFAVLLAYLVFLFFFVFLVVSFIPIIAGQIETLAGRFTEVMNRVVIQQTFSLPFIPAEMNAQLNESVDNVLRAILEGIEADGVLSTLQEYSGQFAVAAKNSWDVLITVSDSVVQFLIKFVIVLVLAFFVQMEKEEILRWTRLLLPYRYRVYAEKKAEAIYYKLSQWIHGQLLLCLVVGVTVFVALNIVGMQKYALTLAVLAAFTEFIPVIGPVIAAVPAIFIAMAEMGFIPGLVIAAIYYAIQLCENNFLVPIIMNRAVGLSPIAVMLAMMIGVSFPSTIHPVIGVLLSVPVATILTVFLQDYLHRGKSSDEES